MYVNNNLSNTNDKVTQLYSDLITNNRFGIKKATVSDCNDLKEGGIWDTGSIANRPNDAVSVIIVLNVSNVIQIGFNIVQKTPPYFRRCIGGVWDEWTRM